MSINTRIFGEIEIEKDKMITFPGGIIGYADLTEFALIHDAEKADRGGIRWLQSLQEPQFALPVTDPLYLLDSYNPEVEDELLKSIGDLSTAEMLVLVTVTVPKVQEEISINLMAPIVINAAERKACQVIIEGDYPVKYPIYDILQARKKENSQKTKGGE